MHHTNEMDNIMLRWQLLEKEFLTPLSYNWIPRLNPRNGKIVNNASITTDHLTGVPSVKVKEMFWVGFGDLCYITDQLVKPINNLWNGVKDSVPSAAKRFPNAIIEKYYPYFAQGDFTGLANKLEEVGDCNKACLPIPKPILMRETEQGKLQFEAFRYDEGLDLGPQIKMAEHSLIKIWSDLNKANYCSPYVTTY